MRPAEVLHRLFGMVRVGSLNLVNDSASTQTHQVSFSQTETQDNVPAVTSYGFTSNPHVGADVISLFAHGDQSKGVVIAVNDRRYRMTGLVSGEVAMFDDLGHSVHFTRTGIVVNAGSTPMRLVGDLHVTGDIVASCDAGPVSALRHVHGKVQPGAGSTALPTAG